MIGGPSIVAASFTTANATAMTTPWLSRLLLEPIGNIPHAKAEALYYATVDDIPIAA